MRDRKTSDRERTRKIHQHRQPSFVCPYVRRIKNRIWWQQLLFPTSLMCLRSRNARHNHSHYYRRGEQHTQWIADNQCYKHVEEKKTSKKKMMKRIKCYAAVCAVHAYTHTLLTKRVARWLRSFPSADDECTSIFLSIKYFFERKKTSRLRPRARVCFLSFVWNDRGENNSDLATRSCIKYWLILINRDDSFEQLINRIE